MAREKVQDKHKAIIDAAVRVFAERGFWDTPTSLISKTAGVADGTLFNYFATKNDLINAVYLEIKKDLAEKMLSGLHAHQTPKDKMRHIWNGYIEWGVYNTDKFKVMHQIGQTYDLEQQIREQSIEPFVEFERLANELVANGVFKEYPLNYLGALLDAFTVTTVQIVSADTNQLAYYQTVGFEILWNGVTR